MNHSLRLSLLGVLCGALFACPSPKPAAVCGDGKIGVGEVCDDGNTVDGDGCAADCQSIGGTGGGNGTTGGGDGATGGGTTVAGGGTAVVGGGTAVVGGGTAVTGGGTAVTGGGTAVTGGGTGVTGGGTGVPVCPNGIPEPPEECDDGNMTPGDGCEADCTLTVACGNGKREGSEVCDDGNNVGGDGCEMNCDAFTNTPTVVGSAGMNVQIPVNETCHVTSGDNGRLITGIILTENVTYVGGQVFIDSTGTITCVGSDCSTATGAATATKLVCPQAVVSPGLINAHDHISFQANPYVGTAERYEHRHDWRQGNNGHTRINNGGNATNLQIRWAEVRQLMAGTTSIVGATYNAGNGGLMRNLDTTPAGQLGNLTGSAGINSDTFPLDDTAGGELTSGCGYPTVPVDVPTAAGTAYIPHVSEGIEASAHNEFVCLTQAKPDGGLGVLSPRTAFVHGVGLTAQDVALMGSQFSSLVWSPRSNVSLYGDTAQVTLYKNLGVNIAMGTDWTISGSMNLLRELRCADSLNQARFNGALTDQHMWRIVTANGADATATTSSIGRIATGRLGDIAIFKRKQGVSFYRSIIEADPQDVIMTMRGGRVMYGDANIISQSGASGCESLNVCGTTKSVCITGDVAAITGTNAGTSLALLQQGNASTYALFYCGTPTNEPSCTPERPVSTINGGNSKNGSTIYSLASMDTDKDGIDDATDNCISVFNPIRPMDNGVQPDTDGDGVGDVCDVCPLNANTTTCTVYDPSDRDSDGYPNVSDNCPAVANPDQLDTDMDGKGDACDLCPTISNPGVAACPTSIYAIKQGVAPTGTAVALSDVLVTGQGTNGFFVAPSTAGFMGTDYSGLFVYAPGNTVAVGDNVSISSGTPTNFYGQIQLSSIAAIADGGIMVNSQANVLRAPIVVPLDFWNNADGGALALEGVLVQVQDATVVLQNPDAGTGDTNPTNEFVLGGDFYVNDYLYRATPLPVVGTFFQSVTGVLEYRNNRFKLEVRGPNDLVTGPPTLAAIGPALAFIRVGDTATLPTPVAVQLSGLAQGDTLVSVVAGSGELLVGDGGAVVVPNGQVAAAVPLLGVTSTDGGTVTLMATLIPADGGVGDMRFSEVRVLAADEASVLTGISPTTATVNAGGTSNFTVTLDAPVVVDTDVQVTLVPNTVGVAPMTVTVPAGGTTATIAVQVDAAAMGNDMGTLTATLGASTVQATLTVSTRITATELLISEYTEANSFNKYIELYNGTGQVADLTQYTVRLYVNGATTVGQNVTLSGTLGDGEALVLCNAQIDALLSPNCDLLTTAVSNVMNFNGDDLVALARNGANIDIIGQSPDPGNGWTVCGVTEGTKDHVMRRKGNITSPTTSWATSAGTNTTDCQWELFTATTTQNVIDNNTMGQHTLTP